MSILSWILTLAIISGQLIRIPLGGGGVNLLDVTVIILCTLGLFQTRLHFKKPPQFIVSAFLFILIALLSLLLTPLHLTATEYLNSLFYTVRLSLYISLGGLLLSGALPSLRKNIDHVLLFSGVGVAILGLFQFIFLPDLGFLTAQGWDPHYFRTVSTFLDPNFTGGYFVLTLILLMSWRGRFTQPILPFILVYLSLLTTFSRSSYLMFLISGLIFSFLKKSKRLAFFVLILFLGLMLGFYIYTIAISQPHNIDRTKSASYRLNTWQQGWQIFQLHPILGVGFNAYRYALRQYNLGDEQFITSHGASSNDSSLLSVAATTGIIGLTCYLFFWVAILKKAWRKNLALTSALVGLTAHSFFANSLFFPPILLWLILILVVPKK